jgi:hypothetical protein
MYSFVSPCTPCLRQAGMQCWASLLPPSLRVAEPLPHAFPVRKVLIPHVKITITHIGALNYVEFRARHAPYVVHGGERGIRTLDPVLSGILA